MSPKYIIFLSSLYNHRKVSDRIEGALAAGFEVELLCYRKKLTPGEPDFATDPRVCVTFAGAPANGGSAGRVLFWGAALAQVRRIIQRRGLPVFFLVNTAEWLIFSSLTAAAKGKTIYDLADIHPKQYSSGLTGRLIRALEAKALARCQMVVVTSPWFFWDYLQLQSKNCPGVYLIENKLTAVEYDSLKPKKIKEPPTSNLIIGWSGILRCNESLALLIALTNNLAGRVKIHLIGVTDQLDPNLLVQAISTGNFLQTGPYTPGQLGQHLVNCDYVWACDFSDGLNSSTLLANRLYQGIAAHIPLLGYQQSAMGRVIAYRGIGPCFDTPDPSTVGDLLNGISAAKYQSYQSAAAALAPRCLRQDEWTFLFEQHAPVIVPVSPQLECVLAGTTQVF